MIELSLKAQVDAFCLGTEAIYSFSQRKVIPLLRGQLGLTNRERALLGTYFRMHCWMHSLVVMNDVRDFQGVSTAARSLFELLIDLILLRRPEQKLIEQFDAHPLIARYNAAKRSVEHRVRNGGDIDEDGCRLFLQRNRQEYEVLKKQLWDDKSPQHWTGMRIEERAKRAGEKYEELYSELYAQWNWQVHSGADSYWRLDEEAFLGIYGLAHIAVQRISLEAIQICAEEFSILQAMPHFHQWLKDVELTSQKALQKETIEELYRLGAQEEME